MPTALSKPSAAAITSGFSEDQVALVKRTIAKDATDDELAMFLNVCRARSLDPFAKEIYFRKYKTKDGPVVAIVTGIDGYRKMAEDSGSYDGQTATEWCGPDGKWKDLWLETGYPFAARVGVYRKGQREPTYAIARWSEYFPSREQDQFMWKRMSCNQLAKCAEALALRKAFPRQLGGVHVVEEMQQAEKADPPPPARYIQQEKDDLNRMRAAAGLDTIPDAPDPEDTDIPADMLASPGQIKAIHTLVSKIGLTDNRYRDRLWGSYKVKSSTELTHAQAGDFLNVLTAMLGKREERVSQMDESGLMRDAVADDPPKESASPTGESRAKLEQEIGNLMGQLGKNGKWFMEKFGKMRAEMTESELDFVRSFLENESPIK